MVLDNIESILRSSDRTGNYREGYEGYGQLLDFVAATPHRSAIVLASQEKPKQLTAPTLASGLESINCFDNHFPGSTRPQARVIRL